mmetsp:Transcript_111138/g.314484  ORF Transcript_111138/g.314484 Transcript_111138/m.314484 type:complete len:242 (+) Transcript_111138:378-1103(+)
MAGTGAQALSSCVAQRTGRSIIRAGAGASHSSSSSESSCSRRTLARMYCSGAETDRTQAPRGSVRGACCSGRATTGRIVASERELASGRPSTGAAWRSTRSGCGSSAGLEDRTLGAAGLVARTGPRRSTGAWARAPGLQAAGLGGPGERDRAASVGVQTGKVLVSHHAVGTAGRSAASRMSSKPRSAPGLPLPLRARQKPLPGFCVTPVGLEPGERTGLSCTVARLPSTPAGRNLCSPDIL